MTTDTNTAAPVNELDLALRAAVVAPKVEPCGKTNNLPTTTENDKPAEPIEVDGIINPAEYNRRFGGLPVGAGMPRRRMPTTKADRFSGDRRYRSNDRNKHK